MINQFSRKHILYRLLVLTTMSLAGIGIYSKECCALDLGTGLTAMEDGDDRLRPAGVVHFANGRFISRFYVYGRDYGPIQERNFLLSLSKRFDVGSKSLQGIVGIAGLSDTTTIHFKDHPEDNMSYSSTNGGMAFGLHWTFLDTKRFQLKATWDAHVFPAGSGFIFLANARKSGLGLTAATVF